MFWAYAKNLPAVGGIKTEAQKIAKDAISGRYYKFDNVIGEQIKQATPVAEHTRFDALINADNK